MVDRPRHSESLAPAEHAGLLVTDFGRLVGPHDDLVRPAARR
ncbi:hypothetical protein [Saccharothrix sp. 6-C]|nr:hypothetical protein [Saccharothrix sp. 6-C]